MEPQKTTEAKQNEPQVISKLHVDFDTSVGWADYTDSEEYEEDHLHSDHKEEEGKEVITAVEKEPVEINNQEEEKKETQEYRGRQRRGRYNNKRGRGQEYRARFDDVEPTEYIGNFAIPVANIRANQDWTSPIFYKSNRCEG